MKDFINKLTNRLPEIVFFVVALILSKLLKVEEHIVAFILLLLLYVLVKVLQYILENKKSFGFIANLFSFLKNEPPIPFGSKVVTNIQNLLVIGDLSKSELIESINNHFLPILKNSYNCFVINNTTEIDIEYESKKLSDLLESAKTVIVFRTLFFENNNWVYETIDKWSKKNTDVPFLFINLTSEEARLLEEQQKPNKIPRKYKYIKIENPGDISLKLLHRAIDRATDWKKLASYNRNILVFLLLVLFGFSFYYYNEQQKRKTHLSGEQVRKSKNAAQHFESCSKEILDQINNNASNPKTVSVLLTLLSEETINFICAENSLESIEDNINIDFWSDTIIDGKTILYTVSRTKPDRKNVLTIFKNDNHSSLIAFSYNHQNKFTYLSASPEDSVFVYTPENPDISNARKLGKVGDSIIIFTYISRNNIYSSRDTVHYQWNSEDDIKELFVYWSTANPKIGFTIMNSLVQDKRSFYNDQTKTLLKNLTSKLSEITKNINLSFSYFLNSPDLVKINWKHIAKNDPSLFEKINKLKTK